MARNTTSSFVLTLPLKTSISDTSALDRYMELSRRYYNAILGKLLKRYYLMIQSKKYIKTCKMSKGKERNILFNEIEKDFGLKGTAVNKLITSLRVNEFKDLGSHVTIKLQLRAIQSIDKLKFKQAHRVNFIRYGEMKSFESSDNKQGIRFRDNIIYFNKLKIPVIIKKNDIYAQMALQNKIKYCRIKRTMIKGKWHYYVQLILDGVPPIKLDSKTGEFKHHIDNTNSKVGIDIGTQTIAYCSDKEIKLLELAPEINNIEKQKRIINRKLDRSRRVTNPNKYNADGTINIKDKTKWIKSNRYIKAQNELRELQRKQSKIRKQSHNRLANKILTLGTNIKVEDMNYKGLQKRSKNTTINKKTGKINTKKRFGKSLANKAPSMFLTILDNKLKWIGKRLLKINTTKVKASQYNHITNEHIKKKLSERWNDFGGYKIQRDLYSSFLIMNVDDSLDSINNEECNNTFDNFIRLHNEEINRLRNIKLNKALKNVI